MQHASSHAPDGAPQFEIAPQGSYSLAASLMFLEGFAPAAYDGGEARDHLHLAFVVDGTENVAGVCVRQRDDPVVGQVFGDVDLDAVRAQVARILSLDVAGRGFAAVGERDPVIAGLQTRYPARAQAWTRLRFGLWSR